MKMSGAAPEALRQADLERRGVKRIDRMVISLRAGGVTDLKWLEQAHERSEQAI